MREPVVGQSSWRTAAAESPPPTTLKPPLPVAVTMASATPLVPAANAGNSNTPIGPFQNTVLAFDSRAVKRFTDSGPMSSPILPSGISSAATVSGGESAANFSATTMSTGRWMTSPKSSRSLRQVSIISSCSSEDPTETP